MDEKNILRLNQLFTEFITYGDRYIESIGKGDKNLNAEQLVAIKATRELVCSRIPNELSQIFDDSKYICEGSIGQGRVASTPWVAIRLKSMYTKQNEHVKSSVVFFLSTNMDKVYVTLDLRASDFTNSGAKQLATIKKFSETTIAAINADDRLFIHNNELDIRNESYKTGAVYAAQWHLDETSVNIEILKSLVDIYNQFHDIQISDNPIMPDYNVFPSKTKTNQSASQESKSDVSKGSKNEDSNSNDNSTTMCLSIKSLTSAIKSTNLIYTDLLIKRLAYSLLTKPFVILSGLAGSGKTQLALALAKALVADEAKQMCVVSVGADWTNREPLLGFPNALEAGKYVRPESGVLDLLIECNKDENKDKPYFLILDEMNLSYVERYFADFLSAMESHEAIKLWKRTEGCEDDTPESVKLPKNLFIIGTINVDETTYMFSPKVLDRANVIEFKVSENDMESFLNAAPDVDINLCSGKAANMATDFVRIASSKKDISKEANDTLNEFFKQLKKVNAEFGYRTATEIGRFISLSIDDLKKDTAIDVAIVQKLLPKLHGSRKKIVPVLKELWKLCGCQELEELENPSTDRATYPLTADKVLRMYHSALDNGFTSFAEA